MNDRSRSRGLIALLCAMLVAALVTLCTATLTGRVARAEEHGDNAITVSYRTGDTPIDGAAIGLHHLAEPDGHGGYTPLGPFADADRYPIDWDLADADQQTLRDLAATISAYIAANGEKPEWTRVTDGDGDASFDGLPDGLYLADIPRTDADGTSCEATSVIVILAGNGHDAIDLTPKTQCIPSRTPPDETTTSIDVRKIWRDGNSPDRPGNVDIGLLRDGSLADTVRLDASNGWSHTFEGLDAGHEYRIVERGVPDGYTVLIDRENDAYTVTNSATPDEQPRTGSGIEAPALAAALLAGIGLIGLRVKGGAHARERGRR